MRKSKDIIIIETLENRKIERYLRKKYDYVYIEEPFSMYLVKGDNTDDLLNNEELNKLLNPTEDNITKFKNYIVTKRKLKEDNVIRRGKSMIRLYYEFGFGNGNTEKFSEVYIDKNTGDIYSGSGIKPLGNVNDKFGGFEYIKDNGDLLARRDIKNRIIELQKQIDSK